MAENKSAAQAGGRIASRARSQLESQTGKSVVTGANYLPPGARMETTTVDASNVPKTHRKSSASR